MLLVDLANHFENGDQRGFAIAAEDRIVPYEGGNGEQIVGDGTLIDQPVFGRRVPLLLEAGDQAGGAKASSF